MPLESIILNYMNSVNIDVCYFLTSTHKITLEITLDRLTKLKSYPTNPAHHKTFHPKYKELFQKNEKAIKPLDLRMETIIREAEVDLTEINKIIIPDIPPWTIFPVEG